MLNLRFLKFCHKFTAPNFSRIHQIRSISNEVLFKQLDNNSEKLLTKYGSSSRFQNMFQEKSKILEAIQELNLELKKSSGDRNSEQDKELVNLIETEIEELQSKGKEISSQILETILELEQEDHKISRNTKLLFEITAGVGGKEAMLFANELFELYYKYFTYKKWQILEMDSDQQANYMRHVRLTLDGLDIWSHMRFEAGVHRVQRVPETEARGRMHTSTVTVACIPLTDEIDVDIKDKDLKMETKRASGAGGQHVNKTESAVRLTHIPTGIAVECQEDRSQVKNREIAIRKLKKILTEQNVHRVFEKMSSTRKSQVGSSFRNEKIRTFNFSQDRLTDHRLSSSTTQSEKNSSLFDLDDFFINPSRLDDLIERLRTIEKEKILFDIFEELK